MSDPVQEGDDICRSCTGLLIYTRERNKRGEKPLCVGVPGVAKGRIQKDELTDLNEKTKVKSRELGIYICFGYSQWSGMMERTGRIPLCISGVQLNIVPRYAPQKKVEEAPKKSAMDAQSTTRVPGELKRSSAPIPGFLDKSVQLSNPHGSTQSTAQSGGNASSSNSRLQLESMVQEFTMLMRKGMVLQYRNMREFYADMTTDMHEKLFSSAKKLTASSVKVAGLIQKYWSEKFR
jgi:hypothetical protein